MEVASSDLMIPLIQSNLGIGFVPEDLALPLLEKQQLVQIRINNTIPPRSIQIVSDKGRRKSTAADAFYQYLKTEHKVKNSK